MATNNASSPGRGMLLGERGRICTGIQNSVKNKLRKIHFMRMFHSECRCRENLERMC